MPRTNLLPILGSQGIDGTENAPQSRVSLDFLIFSEKDNIVNFTGKFRAFFLPDDNGGYFVGTVVVRIGAPIMPNFTHEKQAGGVVTSDDSGSATMGGGIYASIGPGAQDLIITFSKTESYIDFADINFSGQYEIQPMIDY